MVKPKKEWMVEWLSPEDWLQKENVGLDTHSSEQDQDVALDDKWWLILLLLWELHQVVLGSYQDPLNQCLKS